MSDALLLVDADGRVLAVQWTPAASTTGDQPRARLSAAPGQHVLRAQVPDETEKWTGPQLSRLLSGVTVDPSSADVVAIRLVTPEE
jgi:hypothetical protein